MKLKAYSTEDCQEFFAGADDFMDTRDQFFTKWSAIAETVGENSGNAPETKAIQSSIASLSQRIGQHQRVRQPRPTSKTKRPKAHHKRKS